ncbi:acyltransferase [Eubacterium callanderi]|uniref:acyltransferase n=1 Tax=Eubacterium callanderi TaxID=53442 RepID=UPI0022E29B67|nr:acyltransferase family protein [Eubacterium callanderi]
MEERVVYADALRVFSIFFVIMVHIIFMIWSDISIWYRPIKIILFYGGIARPCVPLFVMVSGMFFLDPQKSYSKEHLKKHIIRITKIFVFWSAFYVIFSFAKRGNFDITIKTLYSFLNGYYHLWFLFMLIGLYLITPILRIIVKHGDEKLIKYFLLLSFIVALLVPTITIIPQFSPLRKYISKFYLYIPAGFTFYYLIGYHLKSRPQKRTRLIYCLGLVGAVITILGTYYCSKFTGTLKEFYYGYLTVNVAFMAIAIFVFFKNHANYFDKFKKIICRLSKLTLGVYLIHPCIIEILEKCGLTALRYPAIISIPLNTLLVFIISMLLSYFISKIPFIRQFIL